MKLLYFKLGFSLLLILQVAMVHGQGSLFVHIQDGKQQQILLSEIDKLTFPGENMLVSFNANPLKNYTIPEIKYCNFRNLLNWDILRYAIRIFPNPTNNEFRIESTIEINEIILYDIIGQKLMQTTPNTDVIQLQLNNYARGVYVIRMMTPEGVFSQRIIKD